MAVWDQESFDPSIFFFFFLDVCRFYWVLSVRAECEHLKDRISEFYCIYNLLMAFLKCFKLVIKPLTRFTESVKMLH